MDTERKRCRLQRRFDEVNASIARRGETARLRAIRNNILLLAINLGIALC